VLKFPSYRNQFSIPILVFLVAGFGYCSLAYFSEDRRLYYVPKNLGLLFFSSLSLCLLALKPRVATGLHTIRITTLEWLMLGLFLLQFTFCFIRKQALFDLTCLSTLGLVLYLFAVKLFLGSSPTYRKIYTTVCLLRIVLFFGVLQSLLAVAQFFGIVAYGHEVVFDSTAIGTIGNPNSLAAFLTPLLVFFLPTRLTLNRNLFIQAMCIIALLSAIILTNSRGAWVSLIIGITVLYGSKWLSVLSEFTKVKIIRIAFFAGIIGLVFILSERLIAMNYESAAGRLSVIAFGAKILLDNFLFGIGSGNFAYYFILYVEKFGYASEYGMFVSTAYNQILQLAVEYGAVMGFLFAIICFKIFTRVLRQVKKTNSISGCFQKRAAAALACVLAHSMVDSFMFTVPVVMVWIPCVILLSIKDREALLSIKKSYLIAVIPLSICLCMAAVHQYIPYYHWCKAKAFIAKGNYTTSIKEHEQAVQGINGNGELYYATGLNYLFAGNNDKAIAYFTKAEENFISQDLFYFKALAFEKKSDLSAAIKLYNRSAGLGKGLRPKLQMARLFLSQGDSTKAEIILKELVELTPEENKGSERIQKEAFTLLNKIN